MELGLYQYRVANIVRIIDGDTFDLDIDLGFYTTLRVRIRLADINVVERSHARGADATEFTTTWLRQAMPDLYVQTFKLNPNVPVPNAAFGRWLGQMYDLSGNALSDALRAAGYEST